MTRKTLLLISITLFATQVIQAQRVSMETARLKAEAFFGQSAQAKSTNGQNRSAMELKLAEDSTDLYIFNDAKNGGYVVMSSDERMPEVLGYSKEGCYNAKNVPPGLKDLLDQYKHTTKKLRENPKLQLPKTTTYTNTTVVEPLCKTKWDQWEPYNLLCPDRYPTGCTNTATAQIMYHHKWPVRGKGTVSTTFNDRTITADLCKSTYEWDKMLLQYDDNSNQQSQMAVARLMYDVGICNETQYAFEGSGAILQMEKFTKHFDYDPSIASLPRNACDAIAWDSIVTKELVNSRPMYYCGYASYAGHALVLDGRDAAGYYHFNFGWSGHSDGYYTLSNTEFSINAQIIFGITKNQNRDPRENAYYYTEGEVKHEGLDNVISVAPTFCCLNNCNIRQSALAIENKKIHKVTYTDYSNDYERSDYRLRESLPDGDYLLYPVCRYDGKDKWKKILFNDNANRSFDLKVAGGEYTYTESEIPDAGIRNRVFCINNIYYSLHDDLAYVTYKNERYNCYSGDVKIPEKVTYQGKEYNVYGIEQDAFKGSYINNLTIPKSIWTMAGFGKCSIGRIIFENGSDLGSITGSKFREVTIRSHALTLPNYVTLLDDAAFYYADFSHLFLDRIYFMGKNIIENMIKLRNIVIMNDYYNPKENLCPDYYNIGLCTLYVPKGTSKIYRNTEGWKDFGKIEEFSGVIQDVDGIQYMMNDLDHAAKIVSAYSFKGKTCQIPAYVSANGNQYAVKELMQYSFSFEESKIEEVIIPKTVTKIDEGCFNKLGTLKSLRINRQEPPSAIDRLWDPVWDTEPTFEYEMFSIVKLYVPVGCKKKYASHSFWGQFTHIIEDETLGIDEQPVSNSSNEKAVYTLNGIRVPAAKSKEKSKGIYVQEGKKVIR